MNSEDIQQPFINIEKIFPKSTKNNKYIGIASDNIDLLEDVYKFIIDNKNSQDKEYDTTLSRILVELKTVFESYPYLLVFVKDDLYESLFLKYLHKECNIQIKEQILDLLKIMILNKDCPSYLYELLYNETHNAVKTSEDSDYILQLFKLYTVMYGTNTKQRTLPKNYIVHNGQLTKSVNFVNNIEYNKGITIFLSFYIGMNDLSSLPEFTKDNSPVLLSMKINDYENLTIDFSLQQDFISLNLNLHSGSNQLISRLITNIVPLKWYNITFSLSNSGFRNKHQIKIFLDTKLAIEETFRSKNPKDILQEIELYKNVYGLSTSIIVLGNDTNSFKDKNVFQKNIYEKGLHNLKTLNSFLKNQDNLNIIHIFTPFGKENNVCGNPNIKLNFYYNNISNYLNLTKRIYMIRGLNPFIFILEQLILNKQHLLSNFFIYLELLTTILTKSKYNMLCAIECGFFKHFNYLLQNIPSSLLTIEIINFICKVGDVYMNNFSFLKENLSIENGRFLCEFLSEIYFNIQIMQLFNFELQEKIWLNILKYISLFTCQEELNKGQTNLSYRYVNSFFNIRVIVVYLMEAENNKTINYFLTIEFERIVCKLLQFDLKLNNSEHFTFYLSLLSIKNISRQLKSFILKTLRKAINSLKMSEVELIWLKEFLFQTNFFQILFYLMITEYINIQCEVFLLINTLYVHLGKISCVKDYEENISRLFFINYNIKYDHRKKKLRTFSFSKHNKKEFKNEPNEKMKPIKFGAKKILKQMNENDDRILGMRDYFKQQFFKTQKPKVDMFNLTYSKYGYDKIKELLDDSFFPPISQEKLFTLYDELKSNLLDSFCSTNIFSNKLESEVLFFSGLCYFVKGAYNVELTEKFIDDVNAMTFGQLDPVVENIIMNSYEYLTLLIETFIHLSVLKERNFKDCLSPFMIDGKITKKQIKSIDSCLTKIIPCVEKMLTFSIGMKNDVQRLHYFCSLLSNLKLVYSTKDELAIRSSLDNIHNDTNLNVSDNSDGSNSLSGTPSSSDGSDSLSGTPSSSDDEEKNIIPQRKLTIKQMNIKNKEIYSQIFHGFVITIFSKILPSVSQMLSPLTELDSASYDILSMLCNIFFECVIFLEKSYQMICKECSLFNLEIVPCLLDKVSYSFARLPNYLYSLKQDIKSNIFNILVTPMKTLWDINKYFPLTTFTIKNKQKKEIYEKYLQALVNKFVFCSSGKDYGIFENNLKVLCHVPKTDEKYLYEGMPIIKLIFFYLISMTMISENKNEYIDELYNLTLFLIISNFNVLSTQNKNKCLTKNVYDFINEITYQIIFYTLMLFMHVKQEFSFETSKDIIEKYLVNLFYILRLSLINKNVHNYLKNSLIYEAFYKEILDPKNNKNILINPEVFNLTIKEFENYWTFFKKENIEFWNQNFAKISKDKNFNDFFEEQKITSNWIQRYSNINKIFFFFPKIIDNNIDHTTYKMVKDIFQIKIKPIYLSKMEFNLIQKIEHNIIPNMIHNINKELHIIKIEKYQAMLKKRKEFNSFKKKFIIQQEFSYNSENNKDTDLCFSEKICNHYSEDYTTPLLKKKIFNYDKSKNDIVPKKRVFNFQQMEQILLKISNNVYGFFIESSETIKTFEILVLKKDKVYNGLLFYTDKKILIYKYYREKSKGKKNSFFKEDITKDFLLSMKPRDTEEKYDPTSYILQYLIIPKKITYIFRRVFYYSNSALEIFISDNQSIYIVFPSDEICLSLLQEITSNPLIQIQPIDDYGYINKSFEHLINNPLEIVNHWFNHQITGLKLISCLNIFAGRSYHTLNQYPIFPLTFYPFLEENKNRNLSYPLWFSDINNHFKSNQVNYNYYCIKNISIESTNDDSEKDLSEEYKEYLTVFNKKKLIYNKKYYLLKKDVEIYLSPFLEQNTNEENIHKKHFFTNMFGNVNTYKELNEISPEFFYLPEIFNDLELPEKYQNNKYKLIECFRNELEYSDTSIISWINLIFGVQQLNLNNKNSIDTFPQYITHNSQIKNKIFHRILSNYPNESGKAPLKLFNEIILDKSQRLFSFTYLLNKIQVEQTKTLFQMNLCIDQKRTDPKEKDFPILISQNLDDMDYINIILQSFSYTKLYIEISHKGEVKLVFKNMIKFKKPFNTINPFLSKENVLFINNNYVCVYGFYDSHIEIKSYNNLKNHTIITSYDPTPVTKLCYDKRNQKIYCGYGSGNIIVYHMINECTWKVQKYINDHNGAITDIVYHNGLQVAVTSSKRDKFVNVYTVPSFNLIRKILVIPNIQSNAYISHVFVSNSPVNSISVYLEEENTLKAFTLNGRELQIDDNSNDKFKYSSHCILQSINGIDDFIAFGTENGYFILRKFPDMQKLYEIQVFENIKIEYLLLFTKNNTVFIIGENLNYIAIIKNVETQKRNNKKRLGAFIDNFA